MPPTRYFSAVCALMTLLSGPSCAFVRHSPGTPNARISQALCRVPAESLVEGFRPRDVSCSLTSNDSNDSDDLESLHGFSPQITKIEKLEDFLDFLAHPEDDRLAVIKFYASWCKSCAKFGLRYKKLALEEGDKVDSDGNIVERGRVRFAEAEFSQVARLCRTLGIKRLPYIHMYKGKAGRLADFSCGPAKFQMVIDKVNEFADMSEDEAKLKKTLQEGSVISDKIVMELQEEHFNKALNATGSLSM